MKTTDRKLENNKNARRHAPTNVEPEARQRGQFPTEEQIRRRAHEIYLTRSAGTGHSLLDWLQAEKELEAEREKPCPPDGV